MNRVLNLQQGTALSGSQRDSKTNNLGFLSQAQKRRESEPHTEGSTRDIRKNMGAAGPGYVLEGFTTDSEEAVVQILQATPSLPNNFLGLYEFFVLLRDLLSIQKAALLTPTQGPSSDFEPLLFWNLDQTSLNKLSFRPDELNHYERWFELDDNQFERLSSRDQLGAEDGMIVIRFPFEEPEGVLIFSSPYSTNAQSERRVLFGALSQVLSNNFSAVPNHHAEQHRPIPMDSLIEQREGEMLFISMSEIHQALREHFPMLSAQRIPELIFQTIVSMTEAQVSIEPSGFFVYTPAPFLLVQQEFYKTLIHELCSWFNLDETEEVHWSFYSDIHQVR
jgi:hypothetical protein